MGLLSLPSCALQNEEQQPQAEDVERSHAAVTASGYGLVDVPLWKLYRYRQNAGPDSMTWLRSENIPGYTLDRAMFYVLGADYATTLQTVTLNRLYNGVDHMDSVLQNEGGYPYEGPLAKLLGFQDLEAGLFPIDRYFKTGDHMDLAAWESPPAGYTRDGTLGYGWPAQQARAVPAVDGIGNIDYTVASGVSVGTTIHWGGAIVSLMKDDVDYINRHDAGRLLQSAMWYQDLIPQDNPTEAGDWNSNGSPIVNYDISSPAAGSLHTRAIMMQWGNDTVSTPTTFDNPVLTGSEVEKWVRVENGNRIRYKVQFRFAKSLAPNGQSISPLLEILTSYLVDGTFQSVAAFQWNGSRWASMQGTGCSGASADGVPTDAAVNFCDPTSARAAYIMAWNSSTNRGLALFKKKMIVGSANQNRIRFGYYRFMTDQNQSLPTDNATLKLNVQEEAASGVVQNGTKVYDDVYVLMGSESQIQAQANRLR